MTYWDDISEEQMRSTVVEALTDKRDEMLRQSERSDQSAKDAAWTYFRRREREACARYSRRQAAHYQQAIDLLSAAPMPEAK